MDDNGIALVGTDDEVSVVEPPGEKAPPPGEGVAEGGEMRPKNVLVRIRRIPYRFTGTCTILICTVHTLHTARVTVGWNSWLAGEGG